MTEIPRPEVLDPDRLVHYDRDTLPVEGDLRHEVLALQHALRGSCGYGNQLWDELAALRRYLVRVLPPGPGFEAEQAWNEWTEAYASLVSVMTGPRGDSGFALDEARRLVRGRRDFPPGSTPTPETVVRDGA